MQLRTLGLRSQLIAAAPPRPSPRLKSLDERHIAATVFTHPLPCASIRLHTTGDFRTQPPRKRNRHDSGERTAYTQRKNNIYVNDVT